MSDDYPNSICLTKKYHDDFSPTDLYVPVTDIDNDFTLYDLFRLIHKIEVTIPSIVATFGMSQYYEFLNQINIDRDDDDESNIEYLELSWDVTYDVRITEKSGKPTDQRTISTLSNNKQNYWDDPKNGELPNIMSLHGIGPGCPSRDIDYHECGDDCPKNTSYAVEFSPLNNMAHLPIRISPVVQFFPPYVENDRDFRETGFKLTIIPTLCCLITSVLWELTFAGTTPDEVKEHIQEINDTIEEYRDRLGDDDE